MNTTIYSSVSDTTELDFVMGLLDPSIVADVGAMDGENEGEYVYCICICRKIYRNQSINHFCLFVCIGVYCPDYMIHRTNKFN